MYDVVIIGSGVSGSSIARELSRYNVKCCVLEKEIDVCCGTSKANSGIVHSGYDAKPNSLKAKFNVLGNKKMPKLCKELDIPFQMIGSLVVATNEEDIPRLNDLKAQGDINGVEELSVITSKEELFKLEPNLADNVVAALYAKTAGIVCPFTLNIALAENAADNGIEFKFETEVLDIEKHDDFYILKTNKGDIKTKAVCNAAGVYADKFNNMVSDDKLTITARKGEYQLLDKDAGSHVNHTVFMLPTKFGKGVLVSRTVDGNLIVGPTAKDIDGKEEVNVTSEGLEEIFEKAPLSIKNIPFNKVITSFTGLRAHGDRNDFVIGMAKDANLFFNCAAIESPGLTSCIAIGEYLAKEIASKLNLTENESFNGERKGVVHLHELSYEERAKLIKENPLYGHMICRCEGVSEGEIVDAITRTLGATTTDGVKRRTRAGLGRCQAGFCMSKVMEIISREKNIDIKTVTKSGNDSYLLVGLAKEDCHEDL